MNNQKIINQAAHITPKKESLEADGSITIYSTESGRCFAGQRRGNSRGRVMETLRKFCEWLVSHLPLPSQENELYFQIHCQLAAWAMFLGDDAHTDSIETDLPF